MYHINYEGKVYPCRAKVRSCPYGADRHASNKEELYYKSMKFSPNVEIPQSIKGEIDRTGRLRSLYSLSNTLERVPYPIESIVKNLEYSINRVKGYDPKDIAEDWENTINEASELYAETLVHSIDRDYSFTDYNFPAEVKKRGEDLFESEHGGRAQSHSAYSKRRHLGLRAFEDLIDMKDELHGYEEYRRFGLTNENKASSLGWMEEDFYQFSHDLNTSKMLTRPIFYGNIDEAKEKIKSLDDYELLGAYDDYLISDREIMENVKLARNFEYSPRPDLSKKANINIRKWYDRNKTIVNDWINNAPKRVLLSMEMANELDRRGILRQENAIGSK